MTKEYDKLLFADANGIEAAAPGPAAPGPAAPEPAAPEPAAPEPAAAAGTRPRGAAGNDAGEAGNGLKPYYLPDFQPQSRVIYPGDDVLIQDVMMTTLEGEQVNVLVTGECYLYRYRVAFRKAFRRVSFGMRFLTEEGVQLTGASGVYNDRVVEQVEPDTVYQVCWRFRCNLLGGVYFTNAGVSEHITDDVIMIARHLDAMVFKVITPKHLYDMSRIFLDLDLSFQQVPVPVSQTLEDQATG